MARHRLGQVVPHFSGHFERRKEGDREQHLARVQGLCPDHAQEQKGNFLKLLGGIELSTKTTTSSHRTEKTNVGRWHGLSKENCYPQVSKHFFTSGPVGLNVRGNC